MHLLIGNRHMTYDILDYMLIFGAFACKNFVMFIMVAINSVVTRDWDVNYDLVVHFKKPIEVFFFSE